MVNLKKGELISHLSWGQARVRGITLKKWKRAINISKGVKKYWNRQKVIKEQFKTKTTYFYNFGIRETYSNGNYYVRGYLYTQKNISLDFAKKIIKDTLPRGYTPEEFYKAVEENNKPDDINEVILFREDEKIFRKEVKIY